MQDEQLDPAQVKQGIATSLTPIANLYKTIANEKRLQILLELLTQPRELQELMELLDLKKTALSNHLSYLLEFKLIEKISRGYYQITADGLHILQTALSSYNSINHGRMLRQQQNQYYYQQPPPKPSKYKISNHPEQAASKVSFLGSLTGVVSYLRLEYSMADLAGVSGLAFLSNVPLWSIHRAAINHHQAWPHIYDGIRSVGLELDIYEDTENYPPFGGEIDETDRFRVKKLFNTVSTSLADNQPSIVWGVYGPVFGVVVGFEDEDFIFYQESQELRVNYNQLTAPGGLRAIVVSTGAKTLNQHQVDRMAIKRAIELGDDDAIIADGYTSGPGAFAEWGSQLQTNQEIDVEEHRIMLQVYAEMRNHALKYLQTLVDRYQTKTFVTSLQMSIASYSHVCETLDRLLLLSQDGFSEKNRQESATLLAEMVDLERTAHNHLQDALDSWKE